MKQMICNICGANYTYKLGKWFCPACGAYRAEEFSGEEVTLLSNAAQALRMNSFDLAEDLYYDLTRQYPQNPLGYWGLLLSKYGIKYETDGTGKSLPTCYKSSYADIRRDSYYQKALLYADDESKRHFTEEAESIAAACKEWREEAGKYTYDVFISFKATDENRAETEDLREMQNLYTFLTEQGYKVFFSPVSMRAIAGKNYDAYIFNALDTARVMILYGSKTDYFTSTWVSNEWTRYLRKIDKGEKEQGSLILSYSKISPDTLPRALRSLQALNAESKTFYLDILRTIAQFDTNGEAKASTRANAAPKAPPKKKRGMSVKKSFIVFLIHAAAFFTLAMTGAMIADVMGAEIEEVPLANACLWSAIAAMLLGGFWGVKTAWLLLKAIVKKISLSF